MTEIYKQELQEILSGKVRFLKTGNPIAKDVEAADLTPEPKQAQRELKDLET